MKQPPIFGAAIMALAITTAAPAVAQVTDARSYVMKAGAGDLYEREASKLVLGSSSARLKGFAQMMIKDHTDSSAKVKAAAMQAKLHPAPPKLDADQSKMLADLRAAKGGNRDQLYVTQQKAVHEQALALHQGYAAGGDAPALKTVAGKIVPVVQHHIEMLNGMTM